MQGPEEFERVLDVAVEILTENLRSSTLYHGPDEFEQGVLDMLTGRSQGYRPRGPSDIPQERLPRYQSQRLWSRGEIHQAGHLARCWQQRLRGDARSGCHVRLRRHGKDRWSTRSPLGTLRGASDTRPSLQLTAIRPRDGWRTRICDSAISVSATTISPSLPMPRRWSTFAPIHESASRKASIFGGSTRLTHCHWPCVFTETLEEAEKRKLRAEATVLCPEVVQSGSVRGKYDRAGLYLITQYAVYTPQASRSFHSWQCWSETRRAWRTSTFQRRSRTSRWRCAEPLMRSTTNSSRPTGDTAALQKSGSKTGWLWLTGTRLTGSHPSRIFQLD